MDYNLQFFHTTQCFLGWNFQKNKSQYNNSQQLFRKKDEAEAWPQLERLRESSTRGGIPDLLFFGLPYLDPNSGPDPDPPFFRHNSDV